MALQAWYPASNYSGDNMPNILVYREGRFYNQRVQTLIYNRQDPMKPKIGDQVAIGRYYAMTRGGVTLDASGNIIALREARG